MIFGDLQSMRNAAEPAVAAGEVGITAFRGIKSSLRTRPLNVTRSLPTMTLARWSIALTSAAAAFASAAYAAGYSSMELNDAGR
jgi:hypothetical protein